MHPVGGGESEHIVYDRGSIIARWPIASLEGDRFPRRSPLDANGVPKKVDFRTYLVSDGDVESFAGDVAQVELRGDAPRLLQAVADHEAALSVTAAAA